MVWDGMFRKAKGVHVWCVCVVYMYKDTCTYMSAHAVGFWGHVQTVHIHCVSMCVAMHTVGMHCQCEHTCKLCRCVYPCILFVCLRECAYVLYVYTCKCIGRYPKRNTEEALAPDQNLNHNSFLKSRRDRREFLRARLILMKS